MGEKAVLDEISALEKGEPWPPVVQAVEEPPAEVQVPELAPSAPEPTQVDSLDPVDVEKRLKALKKKLTQISKLKERNEALTQEEATKIAGEPQILADIERLKAYSA